MVDVTNDDIGESNRLKLWEMMLKLRLVEKKAYDLFLQNLIKGTSHLALGQEAIAGALPDMLNNTAPLGESGPGGSLPLQFP